MKTTISQVEAALTEQELKKTERFWDGMSSRWRTVKPGPRWCKVINAIESLERVTGFEKGGDSISIAYSCGKAKGKMLLSEVPAGIRNLIVYSEPVNTYLEYSKK